MSFTIKIKINVKKTALVLLTTITIFGIYLRILSSDGNFVFFMPDSNIYLKSFLGYKTNNVNYILSETVLLKIIFLPFISIFEREVKDLKTVFIPWRVASIFLEAVAMFLLAYRMLGKHKNIEGSLILMFLWSLDPLSILVSSKFLSYFPIYLIFLVIIYLLVEECINYSNNNLAKTIIFGIVLGLISTVRIYFTIFLVLLLFIHTIVQKEKERVFYLLLITILTSVILYTLIPFSEPVYLIGLYLHRSCSETEPSPEGALSSAMALFREFLERIFSIPKNMNKIINALLLLSPLVCFKQNSNLFFAYSNIEVYEYLPMLISIIIFLIIFIVGIAKQVRIIAIFKNEIAFVFSFILWLFFMVTFNIDVFLRVYPFRFIIWFTFVRSLGSSHILKVKKILMVATLFIAIFNIYVLNAIISSKFDYFNVVLNSFSEAFNNIPCKDGTLIVTSYGYMYKLYHALVSPKMTKCQIIDLFDFSNKYSISNESLILLKRIIDSYINSGCDIIYITSWFEYNNYRDPVFCGNFGDYYRLFSSSYKLEELYSSRFLNDLRVFKLQPKS
jgi:hypothetical protein